MTKPAPSRDGRSPLHPDTTTDPETVNGRARARAVADALRSETDSSIACRVARILAGLDLERQGVRP